MGDSAAAKKASSREHFDRWAGQYEDDTVSRWLAQLQLQALEALNVGPADRLLDVGCGTGVAVRAAAARVGRAVGVDLSPAMIARGRELATGLANVEFVVGDSETLPFDDGGFTAVLCTTSFHHYPDPERAVAEMARVLAPGGRIAIADWTTDRLLMRVADLVMRRFQPSHVGSRRSSKFAELFASAGMVDCRVRQLAHGLYAIATARKAV